MNGWTLTLTDEGLFSHWGPMILVLGVLAAHAGVTEGTHYSKSGRQWPSWKQRGLRMLALTIATFIVAMFIDWEVGGVTPLLLSLSVLAPLIFKSLWYCWDKMWEWGTTVHCSARRATVGIFIIHFVVSAVLMMMYS